MIDYQLIGEIPVDLPPGTYAADIVDMRWRTNGAPLIQVKLNFDRHVDTSLIKLTRLERTE